VSASWFDEVVQLAVELGKSEAEVFEFFIGDCDSGVVLARVLGSANDEARRRGCARDEIDDDGVGRQRMPTPVFGDQTEQPMLDLVPLAGTGRKVTDLQGHFEFVRQTLQRLLPQSIAAAIAAPHPR
jgi:hypothetical protein